jgi:hypothetical protein
LDGARELLRPVELPAITRTIIRVKATLRDCRGLQPNRRNEIHSVMQVVEYSTERGRVDGAV